MGILSLFGFGRSRDKPENRTSGSGYTFFMGGSTSGKRVNERTAMQMTAVYSCVRILSEAVACHYNSIDIPMMAVKRKRWNIRFIFCSMTSRTRR